MVSVSDVNSIIFITITLGMCQIYCKGSDMRILRMPRIKAYSRPHKFQHLHKYMSADYVYVCTVCIIAGYQYCGQCLQYRHSGIPGTGQYQTGSSYSGIELVINIVHFDTGLTSYRTIQYSCIYKIV